MCAPEGLAARESALTVRRVGRWSSVVAASKFVKMRGPWLALPTVSSRVAIRSADRRSLRPASEKGRRERSCKPDSVPSSRKVTAISLGPSSRSTSNDLPGRRWKRVVSRCPSLFGLSPGGVCPADSVTRAAVRSYRTVSPIPTAKLESLTAGGLFSVALSLASRPVAVGNHLDPWSPDFPPRVAPKCSRNGRPDLSRRRHASPSAPRAQPRGLLAPCAGGF